MQKTSFVRRQKRFLHGAGYGNRTRLRGLGSHYNSRYTNPASRCIIARPDGKCKQKCSTGFGRWGVFLRECREQLWLFRSRHFHCAESLGEKATRYALRRKYSIEDQLYRGTVITVPYIVYRGWNEKPRTLLSPRFCQSSIRLICAPSLVSLSMMRS